MEFILILGARSDMARALARSFAADGYGIYLAGRNLSELERDAADLRLRYNVEAQAFFLDALALSSHEGFYEQLPQLPCGVICAVGYLGNQDAADTQPKETSLILQTNFNGPVNLLNIAAQRFKERGSGFIVGISSVAGDRGRQSNFAYGSAKAGFTAWLSGLRNRLYPHGIHVLTVKPGFVATAMTEGMGLPPLLTAHVDQVAGDIRKSLRKKTNVLYTRWFWRYIMWVIRSIPESVFKKLTL